MALNRLLSVLLLCLLFFLPEINGHKRWIRVGAILDEDSNVTEVAFRYAIDRINISNQQFGLIPVVQTVRKGDSFNAGKIVCIFAKVGVAAIFGPTLPEINGIIQSIAEHFEIPQFPLFWSPTATFQTPHMAINLWPDANSHSVALAEVLRRMEWTSFTVIYQHDEALIRLQEVLRGHGPNDNPITVRQLPGNFDYRPFLKEIHSASESRIILDCDPDQVLDILEQAKEIGLVAEYMSYFIVSLDAHTIDFGEFKHSLTNITAVRLINPESWEVRNVVNVWADGERRHGRNFVIQPETVPTQAALMYDAINLFINATIGLNLTDIIKTEELKCGEDKRWEFGFQLSTSLKIMKPSGLTGPMKFNGHGRRIFSRFEICELSKTGFKRIGFWDPENGINYTRTYGEVMTQVYEHIHNKTFRVVARTGAPYFTVVKAPDGVILEGNDRYEGYVVDLIDSIAKHLNFKYTFILVPDNNYGSYNTETKKWNGLIKYLLDRQADLAVCDLTITYQRRQAVDFTMPFMTLGISILYSKPEKAPPNLYKFMKPFSTEVWLYVITAFLAMIICTFIIARLNPRDWENPHPCNQNPEELENTWDFKNSMWLTLGSIMGQGCDILPKGISTRLAIGAWWFFSLIMISSYTANLAAFLTTDRMEATIESAEDLVRQTKVKYGCVKGGSTAAFFKESNFSTYQKMGTAMESTRPSVYVKNNDEGVERVEKGKRGYAFLMESTAIEYFVQTKCKLQQIGGLLDSKGYGIAMPFNSPYRSLISGAVLKLQEEGMLHVLKEKWWKHKQGTRCKDDEASKSSNELDMNNVGGVFVVLGVGCAIAFLVAILEFLWNVRKVAIENMITPWEALWCELKFAIQVNKTTKPVKPPSVSSRNSSRSGSDNRSIAANMLKTAGSFLHLDNVFEKK